MWMDISYVYVRSQVIEILFLSQAHSRYSALILAYNGDQNCSLFFIVLHAVTWSETNQSTDMFHCSFVAINSVQDIIIKYAIANNAIIACGGEQERFQRLKSKVLMGYKEVLSFLKIVLCKLNRLQIHKNYGLMGHHWRVCDSKDLNYNRYKYGYI